jgi:hypothetical protein
MEAFCFASIMGGLVGLLWGQRMRKRRVFLLLLLGKAFNHNNNIAIFFFFFLQYWGLNSGPTP